MRKRDLIITTLTLVLIVLLLPLTMGASNIKTSGFLNAYGTYSAPYFRLTRKNDNYVYDDTASSANYFSRTTTWADTDVALDDETTITGGWATTIPGTVSPGAYDITYWEMAGATAANTDTFLYAYYIDITGYGKVNVISQY